MTVYAFAKRRKIKIGYSANVKSRLADHRRAHGNIKIIALLDGGRGLERQLHNEFAQYCVGGEWFEDNDVVRAGLAAAVGSQPVVPEPLEHYGPFLDFAQKEAIKEQQSSRYFAFANEHDKLRIAMQPDIEALPSSLRNMIESSDQTVQNHRYRLAYFFNDESVRDFERDDLAAAVLRNQMLRQNMLVCHQEQDERDRHQR